MPKQTIWVLMFLFLGTLSLNAQSDPPLGHGLAVIISVDDKPDDRARWRRAVAIKEALQSQLDFESAPILHLHADTEGRSGDTGPAGAMAMERLFRQLTWCMEPRDRLYVFLLVPADYAYGRTRFHLPDGIVEADELASWIGAIKVRRRWVFCQTDSGTGALPDLQSHGIAGAARSVPYQSGDGDFVLSWIEAQANLIERSGGDIPTLRSVLIETRKARPIASVPKDRSYDDYRLTAGEWSEEARARLTTVLEEFKPGPVFSTLTDEQADAWTEVESSDLPSRARRLADYWVREDKSTKAGNLLEKHLETAPKDWRARLQLARIRWSGGELEKAEALLNLVLADVPDHAEALTLRGDSRLRLKKPEEAHEDWERCIKLHPGAVEPYLLKIQDWSGDAEHVDDVSRLGQWFRELSPRYFDSEYRQARTAFDERDFHRTQRHLDRMILLGNAESRVLGLLARTYYERGRPNDARASAARALDMDPENPDALIVMKLLGER